MADAQLWSDDEWRAAMSTKEINDLPDSDFAYIEPGGEKDDDGKTTPRSLRHYPINDEAHVRNALARAGAAVAGDDDDAKAIAEKAMPKIEAAAKKLGIEVEEKAAGDNDACNRCNGQGTIDLGGTTVECPQCEGSGDSDGNTDEENSRPGLPATAARAEMRGVTEQRVAPRSQFELREVPNGTGGTNLRFTGFASVTGDDAAYEMEDMLGPWTESVSVGSFAKTLSQNADVAFLLNHTGMTLARTKPGTLRLSEQVDPQTSPIDGMTGLHSEADLDPKNMYVSAMRSAVERGDLDEMSFAFRVMRQDWNQDYTRRWINEVSLDKGDVSLVNYGANPTTGGTVTLRQKLGIRGSGDANERLVAIVKNLRLLAATYEVREGKVISAAIEAKLKEALAALHSTDDTDIPGIVKALQAIDAALDVGQAGISAVLQMADPDGDPNDLEPALVPPPGDDSARTIYVPFDVRADKLRVEAARSPR